MHVSTKRMLWRNWNSSRKMQNSASANLTFDFIKTVLHHRHIIAECFDFLGKAISLNSCDYLWGVLFYWLSQIKYFLLLLGCTRPTSKAKTFTESCSRKNCSEKSRKFHSMESLMKSFLGKLQPVSCEEELHHKSFLMTFAKFWRALFLENSCFKEIVKDTSTETVFMWACQNLAL